jgi:hypothetical protein
MNKLSGVEIFSAGKWNGDSYTTDDLDQMVATFDKHKDNVRPYLKLGHADDQKVLKELLESAGDAMPAAGFVERIYRKGEKLLADFVDIPNKIYDLIQKKAYRKVSSEIYWNVEVNKTKHKYMLGAVSLLGATLPGVENLSDLLSMYGLKPCGPTKSYAAQETDVRMYALDPIDITTVEEPDMTLEEQLAAERAKTAQLEAEKKNFSSEIEAAKKREEKLAAEKAEAEKRVFASEAETKKVALEKEVDGLIAEKLITKGMRPYALALMGDEPSNEKKTYSLKVGEKAVEFSKIELVKELAKLFSKKSEVNLNERSEDGNSETQFQKEATVEEVEKYAADKKVSFSEAARALYRKKLANKTVTTDKED